jgi:sulfur-oxidizing protein SoxY
MSSPISPPCARPEPALSRREAMAAGVAGLALAAMPLSVQAATPPALSELIARVTEGAEPALARISFDIPRLVENGNSVDVAIKVESPMTDADHVRWIHIIAEKNPFPDVARFHLFPRSGRADIRATLRLATSQKVAAIAALSGGGYVMAEADIVVTLSACIDGG